MKTTIVFALLSLFDFVMGDATYPPSGYRPSGPKFELPLSHYGSPVLATKNALPILPATNFRSNNDQQNNVNKIYRYVFEEDSGKRREQGNFLNQDNFSRNNQQYGVPFVPNVEENNFDQRNQGRQSSGTNYNFNNMHRYTPPRQDFGPSQPDFDKYGTPNRQMQNAIYQQSGGSRQVDTFANDRKYNFNRKAYQPPKPQNLGSEFSRDADDEDIIGVTNQNYLPPSTTEAFVRKATESSSSKEPVDSQEDVRDGNVAVSTAFAKGRYYLVQPNSAFQRLTYSNDDQIQRLSKNTDYSGRLLYQHLSPFYSYSMPTLIRIY